jgi:hypothetical protein
MSELLVNEDRVITITPGGIWIPGIPSYTQVLSSKCKANNKHIITDISWVMSGCVLIAMISFISGGGSIVHTRVKCKCEGQLPLAENDQGTCHGSFLMSVGPPPVIVNCDCNFKITSAGQTKAKGI